MPISKEQRAMYPKNWKTISKRIREGRADNRCECTGQCGSAHDDDRCSAPNRTRILRHSDAPERWRLYDEVLTELGVETLHDAHRVRERLAPLHPLQPWLSRGVDIVLTVAHLDHNPKNNDPSNLLAMCQRCHLRLDHEQHCKNARLTRDRKAGQMRLFEVA